MKRKYQNTVLCIAALAVFLLSVCGCHAMYPIDVTIPDAELCPPVVDLLLPIDKDSPQYRELSHIATYALDMDEESIRKTGLYRYQTDGYRSMTLHYGLSDYRIEKQSDGSCQVKLYLNGRYEFEDLCERFQTFRIAAADKAGNIIYVSDVYRFELQENVYLDGILFNAEAATVTPSYTYDRPLWLVLLEGLSEIGIRIMPVASIAWLIFVVILRMKEGKAYPNYRSVLPFALCLLPLAVYFGCRLDYAVKTESSLSSIWTDFLSLDPPWMLVYDLIPVVLLVGVAGWALYLADQTCAPAQDTSDQE